MEHCPLLIIDGNPTFPVARPVCCDIHKLSFSCHLKGKNHHVTIDFNPMLYERCKEGNTLILQIHPGAYGWPWYQKYTKKEA